MNMSVNKYVYIRIIYSQSSLIISCSDNELSYQQLQDVLSFSYHFTFDNNISFLNIQVTIKYIFIDTYYLNTWGNIAIVMLLNYTITQTTINILELNIAEKNIS